MKSLQQYRIPFTGLKLGRHNFEFDVNQEFFNEFEYSLVKNGKLKVDVVLDKQEILMILEFHIRGEIFSSCDVCLADFPSTVDFKERQIVKFSDKDIEEDTEEILVLSKQDYEIDISNLLYEYINVAVPFIKRCDDVGNTAWCDSSMIEKLKQLSEKEQETDSADPRWEALKNIKNK